MKASDDMDWCVNAIWGGFLVLMSCFLSMMAIDEWVRVPYQSTTMVMVVGGRLLMTGGAALAWAVTAYAIFVEFRKH